MAKAKETSLWNWLSEARKFYRENLDLQRIENLVGTGTPDTEGHLRDCSSFWIELKSLEEPKALNSNVNHQVSQEQISWIYNRTASGGNAWVLFQFGSGALAEKYLLPGANILELQQPITYGHLKTLSILVSSLPPEGVIHAAALGFPYPPEKS